MSLKSGAHLPTVCESTANNGYLGWSSVNWIVNQRYFLQSGNTYAFLAADLLGWEVHCNFRGPRTIAFSLALSLTSLY